MFHCAALLHEDEGMRRQFAVVELGLEAGQPSSGSHADHSN